MECNKEEAIRAKEIAERKMQNGDFVGARRIGMKAQQLYPDLDNISQLLMVCEVHCAAQNKLNGSETDWYGILQIEQFSDESAVKKQFRKLALSLHPDKNKFAGAEAAFKLIGEANRVLTDPTKRHLFDLKCRGALKPVTPKPAPDQSNLNSFFKKQHGAATKFSNASHSQHMSRHTYQQPQQPTFWTCCPSCNMRYQYYREFQKKMLRCQSCQQPFMAHDLGIPVESSWSQFINEKKVPNQGSSKFVPPNNAGKPSGISFLHRSSESSSMAKAGKATDLGGRFQPKEVKMETAAGTGGKFKPQEWVNGRVDVKAGKRDGPLSMADVVKTKGFGTSESASNKRQRKSVGESSENFDKGKTGGSEGNVVTEQNPDLSVRNSGSSDGHHSRRSSRQKQHISYKENLSDDDYDSAGPPPKRCKGNSSPSVTAGKMKETSVNGRKGDLSAGFATSVLNGDNKECKQEAGSIHGNRPSTKNGKTGDSKAEGEVASMSEKDGLKLENNDQKSQFDTNELNSNGALKSDILVYPDPDFSDFERGRAENCFAVNQVWAVYDSLDGMPRYYARVKKVNTPGFKLQITWLEASSNDDAEQQWRDLKLPIACGRYQNGNTDKTVDRLMFSHQMYCLNGAHRGIHFIYPKKGETWAVFKNWDMDWYLEPEKHKPPYEYEFVEIMTDFDIDVGIGVAYLKKVKGFTSIFQQAYCNDVLSFRIKPSELYRFSHRIPSFKMTGKEGEGVPAGSYELDTAALPCNSGNLVDTDEICMQKNLRSCAKNEIPALRRSQRETIGPHNGDNDAGVYQQAIEKDGDNVGSLGKPTQLEGRSAFHNIEKFSTPKLKKNKFTVDALTPRRSPRDLSRSSQLNASQSTTEGTDEHVAAGKVARHGRPAFSSCQPEDKMHLHVKDGSLGNSMKARKSSGRVIEVEPYDFKKEKSEDKFQLDQIWALKSDNDGLPKNYAQVKKIESASGFILHVAILEAISLQKDMMQPASCGTFKVKSGKLKVLPATAFSHQVKAKSIGKNKFEIYPRRGEVWAVYKRNAELTCSDKGAGECDIVEVVEDNDSGVRVVGLKRVKGSDSFFVAPKRLKSGIMDIPRADFARFSHQCLAFQHTGGRESGLRGCWELDPSSIPGSVILVD